MAQPGAQLETEPGTKVLTISETLILVEQAVRMTQQRDPDYQPTPMLTKAVEYAQRFATNKNKDTVQKIRMCAGPLQCSGPLAAACRRRH